MSARRLARVIGAPVLMFGAVGLLGWGWYPLAKLVDRAFHIGDPVSTAFTLLLGLLLGLTVYLVDMMLGGPGHD